MIYGSTVQKLNENLAKLRKEFGEHAVLSRQQILDFARQKGVKITSAFWVHQETADGNYDLKTRDFTGMIGKAVKREEAPRPAPAAAPAIRKAPSPQREPVPTLAPPVPQKQTVVAPPTGQFRVDGIIPDQKAWFVPWGNYADIERLIATKKWFTAYITGDKGTGKNIMVEQACAKLGRPLVRVNITRETKEEQLVGSKTLHDGNIVYEDGPVIWAAENGAVLLIDEISLGDPNETMCLQAVLEGGPFFVKAANRMVFPKPGFVVIACDNTKGRGSDDGRFTGTNIMNDAFLDRFDYTFEQMYPPLKIEREIFAKEYLRHSENVDQLFIEQLTDWVAIIRKTYADEGIDEQIATRRGCAIVRAVANRFFNIDDSVEKCCNRFNDTTKEAMLSLWAKLKSGEIQNTEKTA